MRVAILAAGLCAVPAGAAPARPTSPPTLEVMEKVAESVAKLEPAAPAATPPATPAERTERTRLAGELMAESGSADLVKQMAPAVIDMMMPRIAAANAGREAEIRTILTEEMNAAMGAAMPAITEKSRDLYAEAFTADELRQMLAYQRSPVGRKAVRLMPDIQMQMLRFGQEAGQAAVAVALPRILDRLKAANMAVPTSS